MTSPTEQAPAAGVEAAGWRWRPLGVTDDVWSGGTSYPRFVDGWEIQPLYPQPAIDALRAIIADLEARLRTARADALEDAGAAAWWATYNAAFGYNGATVCDEIADAARDAIRALNPPEKPHDAS